MQRDVIYLKKGLVDEIRDIAAAPGPAADLDELHFKGPPVVIGQNRVLIYRHENRVDLVFAVITEPGPPVLMAVLDDGAHAPKISVNQRRHRLGVGREVA